MTTDRERAQDYEDQGHDDALAEADAYEAQRDPTATHHAQILDWLSAALTDEDTEEIRLVQSAEPGRWLVNVEKVVDPAKEAAALSAYDEAMEFALAREMNGNPTEDPETAGKYRQPYDLGGITAPNPYACQCPECREYALREKALKAVTAAIGEQMDRILKEEKTEVPPAFRPDPGPAVASYFAQRYAPEVYWKAPTVPTDDAKADVMEGYGVGFLLPGEEVVNTDAQVFRLTSGDQWEAILDKDVEWTATATGNEVSVVLEFRPNRDLLLALYGYAPEDDDETGVAYRADTPEAIQRAKDDLFRTLSDEEDDR